MTTDEILALVACVIIAAIIVWAVKRFTAPVWEL